MKIIPKITPKVFDKADQGGVLASGGGGLPSTLGATYGAELSTETTSRAAYPEFTGIITLTSGNGQLEKNDSGSWGVAVSMAPGDFYRCRATSDADYSQPVVVEVDLPDTYTIYTRAADVTPDQFTIPAKTNQDINSIITSDSVSVTGFEAPITISISGGTFQLNGTGGFGSTSRTFNIGDTFEAQVLSSPSYETETFCIVTIGGVSGSFVVTTEADQPGTGLPTEDLISSYDGVMSADGSKVLAVENRGNESQLLPTVIAGDDNGYVPAGVLDITGYTEISVALRFSREAFNIGTTEVIAWITHSGGDGIKILFDISERINVGVDDGTAYSIWDDVNKDFSGLCSVVLTFSGTTLEGVLNGTSFGTLPATFDFSTASGLVTLLGRDTGDLQVSGGIYWDVCIYDRALSTAEAEAWHNGTLEDASLVRAFVPGEAGSDTVWDTVTGLSYEGTNFTGAAIVEKTDGTGSSFINEEGYTIADGVTMYTTAAASVLVPEGTIVPAGCGFYSSGDAFVTENPGPLAADMEVRNMACLEGDNSGYAVKLGVTNTVLNKVAFDLYCHVGVDKDTTPMQPVAVVREVSDRTYEGVILGGFTSYLDNEIITVASNGTARSAWTSASDVIAIGWHFIEIIWDNTNSNHQIWIDGTRVDNTTYNNQAQLALHDVAFLAESDGGKVTANNNFGIANVKLYDTSDELCNHWPCQDQLPGDTSGTLVRDAVGGVDLTLTGFTGTAWGLRDEGENHLAKGYNINSGLIYADPSNAGFDIDGNALTYLEGEWDTFQNMGVDVLGPFAAEAQALIEFTAGQEFDFGGAPFNTSDYVFNGTTGGAIYSEAQDQSVIDEIIAVIGDGT